jgi:hypothetical protein
MMGAGRFPVVKGHIGKSDYLKVHTDKIDVALLPRCVPRQGFFVHYAFVVRPAEKNLYRVGERYGEVVLKKKLADRRHPGWGEIGYHDARVL